MKNQLVYAEVMNGITFDMMEDKMVVIISDNTTFIVTTQENSVKYNEEFYPVSAEARKSYRLHIDEKLGRITMSI